MSAARDALAGGPFAAVFAPLAAMDASRQASFAAAVHVAPGELGGKRGLSEKILATGIFAPKSSTLDPYR